MALTTIGQQKTPSRPVEVALGAQDSPPSDLQKLLLIGAMGPTGGPSGGGSVSGTELPYTLVELSNVATVASVSGEAVRKFGNGSQLALMVIAAVRANEAGSVHPTIECVPLPQGATTFGTTDQALTTAAQLSKADIRVSPFDGNNATLRGKLKDHCALVSGAQRTSNGQYGSTGVVANYSVADPANLPVPDTQFLMCVWLRDAGADGANAYSVAECAAAAGARAAGQGVPFVPLDNVTINGQPAPANMADWITVGAGLESETALDKGWTPLSVKANGEVAFVRTVTCRVTVEADGVTAVTAYYDLQDFQVLYYFRKTVATRFSQVDFTNVKASEEKARNAKGEVVRMMGAFQDNQMFQGVDQLAKLVVVQRNEIDRSRFDVFIPVNVVPGLHVIATRIEAGTLFDAFTI
jgi:phage tail sheath gpL-like